MISGGDTKDVKLGQAKFLACGPGFDQPYDATTCGEPLAVKIDTACSGLPADKQWACYSFALDTILGRYRELKAGTESAAGNTAKFAKAARGDTDKPFDLVPAFARGARKAQRGLVPVDPAHYPISIDPTLEAYITSGKLDHAAARRLEQLYRDAIVEFSSGEAPSGTTLDAVAGSLVQQITMNPTFVRRLYDALPATSSVKVTIEVAVVAAPGDKEAERKRLLLLPANAVAISVEAKKDDKNYKALLATFLARAYVKDVKSVAGATIEIDVAPAELFAGIRKDDKAVESDRLALALRDAFVDARQAFYRTPEVKDRVAALEADAGKLREFRAAADVDLAKAVVVAIVGDKGDKKIDPTKEADLIGTLAKQFVGEVQVEKNGDAVAVKSVALEDWSTAEAPYDFLDDMGASGNPMRRRNINRLWNDAMEKAGNAASEYAATQKAAKDLTAVSLRVDLGKRVGEKDFDAWLDGATIEKVEKDGKITWGDVPTDIFESDAQLLGLETAQLASDFRQDKARLYREALAAAAGSKGSDLTADEKKTVTRKFKRVTAAQRLKKENGSLLEIRNLAIDPDKTSLTAIAFKKKDDDHIEGLSATLRLIFFDVRREEHSNVLGHIAVGAVTYAQKLPTFWGAAEQKLKWSAAFLDLLYPDPFTSGGNVGVFDAGTDFKLTSVRASTALASKWKDIGDKLRGAENTFTTGLFAPFYGQATDEIIGNFHHWKWSYPAGVTTGVMDKVSFDFGDQPAEQPARFTLTLQGNYGYRSRVNLRSDAKDPMTHKPDQFDIFAPTREVGVGGMASVVLVRGLNLAVAGAFVEKHGMGETAPGEKAPGMSAYDLALSVYPTFADESKLYVGAGLTQSESSADPSHASSTLLSALAKYEFAKKYTAFLGINSFNDHSERRVDGSGGDVVLTPGGTVPGVTVPTGMRGNEVAVGGSVKLNDQWELGLNATYATSDHVEGNAPVSSWFVGPTLKMITSPKK